MWALADEGESSPNIKASEHQDTLRSITVNSFEP
jgi:hypothetical protein